MSEKLLTPIEIGLTAAIVAIEANEPLILSASASEGDKLAGLPFGPFDAVSHRTFEIGLRAWVEEQAGLRLGYSSSSIPSAIAAATPRPPTAPPMLPRSATWR